MLPAAAAIGGKKEPIRPYLNSCIRCPFTLAFTHIKTIILTTNMSPKSLEVGDGERRELKLNGNLINSEVRKNQGSLLIQMQTGSQ